MSKFATCSLPEPITLMCKAGVLIDTLPTHFLEAAKQLELRQAKNAIAILNNAPITISENVWGWIIATTAYCQQGIFKTAIQVAERGLQHAGKNTCLFDCLGVAFSGLKDYLNAQQSFLQAIQLDAQNSNAFINLANIFLAQEDIDAAFETLQQGLKQNPDNPKIRQLYLQLHPAWIQPLIGGKLRLRLLAPLDEDFLLRCFTDQTFMNSYHRFAGLNQNRQRIQNNLKKQPRYNLIERKSVHWLIERAEKPNMETSSYQPIGLATFADIQLNYQRAELLIGFPEKNLRGHGIPLTAMLLLLDFAFNRIGFNKLTTIVYGDNHHSQRSTLALGFKQEGFRSKQLRDALTGEWLDIYDNGLLQEDFRSNERLARLFTRLLGFEISRSTKEKKVFE